MAAAALLANHGLVVVAPGLERPNPVNFALSFVRLKDWSELDNQHIRSFAARSASRPSIRSRLIRSISRRVASTTNALRAVFQTGRSTAPLPT